MKTAIKRVIPFLLSFVILCVFAVQCFRAPSASANGVNNATNTTINTGSYASKP